MEERHACLAAAEFLTQINTRCARTIDINRDLFRQTIPFQEFYLAREQPKEPPMEWERIQKRPEDCAGANLADYEKFVQAFSWKDARSLLDGLPGGGINIAHEAIDRHVKAGRGGKLALR